jgi:hypothetical protein
MPLPDIDPQNDAINDGGFMAQSNKFTTVGDPYVDTLPRALHETKGKRQFLTCGPKQGQTADNWGPGPRTFLNASEGDPYATASEKEGKHRKAQISRFLHPNGFKYSHPMRQSSTPGDYEGTYFTGPCAGMRENISNGGYPARGTKTLITELLEKKNILTSPITTGGYGYHNTTIGPAPPYTGDLYDRSHDVRKQERLTHEAKIGERKPFKAMAHPVDFIDGHEHVAASSIHSWDDGCKLRPHPPEHNMTPKERVSHRAIVRKHGVMVEGYKPFRPSNIKPLYETGGAFSPYPPAYANEKYDDVALRHAMMSDRNAPVKRMNEKYGLSEQIKERKPWRPNNARKTKLTRGTACIGINRHNI